MQHPRVARCSIAESTTPSSLMFHLEVEERDDLLDQVDAASKLEAIEDQVQALTDPTSLLESRLMRDVRVIKAALLADEDELDVAVLATRLAALGYRVALRTAVGGGHGTTCFANLRHEFLVIFPSDSSSGTPQYPSQDSVAAGGPEILIVDPNFTEHFEISHPTTLYSAILSCVPSEFVGPPVRLRPLVQLLAAEMLDAFHAQGLERPPWRKASSILTKWLPERTKVQDRQPASPQGEQQAAAAAAAGGCSTAGNSPQTKCTLAACAFCRDGSSSQQQLMMQRAPRAVADYLEALASTAGKLRPLQDTDGGGGSHTGERQGNRAASEGRDAQSASGQQKPQVTRRRSLLSSHLAAAPSRQPELANSGGRDFAPLPATSCVLQPVRTVRLCG